MGRVSARFYLSYLLDRREEERARESQRLYSEDVEWARKS